MWTILFAITTTIFAIKWFIEKVKFTALIYYMVCRNYAAPTKEELERCITMVTRKKVESLIKK